jgi:hypothetical protein
MMDNGIEGQVIIRPVSPVERPGMANYRPYQAHIRVLDEQGRPVADFRSRPDGHFEVHLAPGAYVLRPESEGFYPRAQDQKVIVEKNRFTSVRITYDSGMR